MREANYDIRLGIDHCFGVYPRVITLQSGEDVVTTGLSSREAMEAIASEGGQVIAAASLVDRSGGQAAFDVPFFPLVELNFPTYAEDDVPAELARLPAIKPGSRKK